MFLTVFNKQYFYFQSGTNAFDIQLRIITIMIPFAC